MGCFQFLMQKNPLSLILGDGTDTMWWGAGGCSSVVYTRLSWVQSSGHWHPAGVPETYWDYTTMYLYSSCIWEVKWATHLQLSFGPTTTVVYRMLIKMPRNLHRLAHVICRALRGRSKPVCSGKRGALRLYASHGCAFFYLGLPFVFCPQIQGSASIHLQAWS